MFIDVSYCEAKLQVKVNLGMFLRRATVDPLAITNFRKSVSVGDYYCTYDSSLFFGLH